MAAGQPARPAAGSELAGTPGPGTVAGLVLLAGFALLGPTGLLLAAGLLAVQVIADRAGRARRAASTPRWPSWWNWLPPAALALIGLLGALFPPGSAYSVTERWPGQLLSGLAVLAAATGALSTTRLTGRPRRSSRRSKPNQDAAATAVAASAVSQNSSPK